MKIPRTWNDVLYGLTNRSFKLWERLGIHAVALSYSQPIPDTRTLGDRLWVRKPECTGIDFATERQSALLFEFSSRFASEYRQFPRWQTPVPHQYFKNNDFFGPVDAEILYCMIRHFRPKKVIEVGSGFSTMLSAQAIIRNREEHCSSCEFVAVEPYPREVIRRGFDGLTRLIPKPVQEVPPDEFDSLGENDILFIDSSHCLKIGSDVSYEVLELLPRLGKGVLIHFHDIFLPDEYPKKWILEDRIFVNEQYVVQAFLTFNSHFEILWASHYMHTRCRGEIVKSIDPFEGSFPEIGPTSLWIRKTTA